MGTKTHTDLAPLGTVLRDAASKNYGAEAVAILQPSVAVPTLNVVPWPRAELIIQQLTPTQHTRILLITADGDPGGGVTNVLQLCRALKKTGAWSVALCSQANSYAIQQARSICDEVHEIDFFTSRFDPRVTWKLRRLIRNISPDLIHCHGSRAALPTAYAVGRNGPPLVNTVHGFHFYRKSRLSRVLAIGAEQWITRRAERTIFVCEDDKSTARREHIFQSARSNVTIHHGIDLKDLPPRQKATKPTVVLLARLVPQKHPEMLIGIAELLRDTGILFKFIGGGPLLPALQAEVERRQLEDIVSFSGNLSREDALRLAATADLAILPSRWEGFPIALLELLGMGIPVIASSVNGIPEVIRDGWNGFLVKGRSPRIYAERIRWLIQNPAMRSAFGRNARNSIAEHFSESRMSTEHIAVYRQAIASRVQIAPTPRVTIE